MLGHFQRTSHPETGAIPCCTVESRATIMWPDSNISLAVDLWDKLDLRLSVYNMLDRSYAFPSPPGTLSLDYPAPGRSVVLRATYRFSARKR